MAKTITRRRPVNDNKPSNTRKYKNVIGWIVLVLLSVLGLYITFY